MGNSMGVFIWLLFLLTTKFCLMIFTQVVRSLFPIVTDPLPQMVKKRRFMENSKQTHSMLLLSSPPMWILGSLRCTKMRVSVAQSCLTLQPHQAPVHGILQARLVEYVSISFSSRSLWPRDWTQVCIAGRFFTIWATREVQSTPRWLLFCHGLCSEDRPRLFLINSSWNEVVVLKRK